MSELSPRARELVAHLDLMPHPEGGFYRERIRAEERVVHPRTGQSRAALTCIEFLLPRGTFSALHVVRQIEVWHHLEGGPLALHLLDPAAQSHRVITLGKDVAGGQVVQAAVPPDVYQAAVALDGDVLSGCSVAPGFEFADFAMPSRHEVIALFPAHRALVERLTRP
jgi:predicted cupin superfamily sugar epimerase